MKRIICPFHKEDTPSMVIYPEAAYCFGCGKKAKLEEVGEEYKGGPEIVEDIDSTIQYIFTLPMTKIRGCNLHSDELFYYILWPEADYYIKRFKHDMGVRTKYICPKGHERPLFTYGAGPELIIIEGELNAESLISALTVMSPNGHKMLSRKYTVMSPGGVSTMSKHLTEYLQYDTIKVIADLDKAGVAAGLQLVDELVKRGKKVEHYFFEEDANDLLVKYGIKEIRNRYNLDV